MSEHPSEVNRWAKMTDKWGTSILDDDGRVIRTWEYRFTGPDHQEIIIQNQAAGHTYGPPGTKGNQGSHYNVRPVNKKGEPIRNGHVDGTLGHYGWGDWSNV